MKKFFSILSVALLSGAALFATSCSGSGSKDGKEDKDSVTNVADMDNDQLIEQFGVVLNKAYDEFVKNGELTPETDKAGQEISDLLEKRELTDAQQEKLANLMSTYQEKLMNAAMANQSNNEESYNDEEYNYGESEEVPAETVEVEEYYN